MNTLSIILYLIDVLGNLQGLLAVSAFCCALATVFITLFWIMDSSKYDGKIIRPYHGIIPLSCIFIVVVLALIAVAIPSRQTMQMIAVSEASEMVIMNDEVRSVMADVKDVLKAQLNKLKE